MRKLGLLRDIDLALHLPLRYDDETRITRLSDAREGDTVQLEGTVTASEVQLGPRRQWLVTLHDGSGECVLRFFSFYPSQQQMVRVGVRIRARGEVRGGLWGRTMMHPQVQSADADLPTDLTPVYPTGAGLPQPYLRRAVALGISLEPDVICLTGDFITASDSRLEGYASVLAPLAQAAPTFACLGNHDGGWWTKIHGGFGDSQAVRGLLNDAGVTLLHNAHAEISVRDWKITVAGVGDFWSGEMNPLPIFSVPAAPESAATVLMSHNPDTKNFLKPFAWDLLLCGHTHGGQVRLPFIGTPFAPVQDKTFVQGLRRWENRWVHITKGVGNLHGVRFNCRPEVSLLSLV